MAIGVIFKFDDATVEQYDEACRGLNNGKTMNSLSDWPDGGCLAHVAGATPEGLVVVDVWESEHAFAAFGEKLMPQVVAAGIKPAPPQIFPVHNLVTT